MILIKEILKSVFIWLFVAVIVVLFILFPRDIQFDGRKLNYEFSWSKYEKNVSDYFSQLATGELGVTPFGEPVNELLLRFLSRSLPVIGIAFLLSFLLGVLKGIYDYRHLHKKTNLLGHGTTWFFLALPDFFTILLIQWILIELIQKGYLPHFAMFDTEYWYSFILPSILLSILPTFYIARITSSALAAQEKELYIRTARAKGLTQRIVIYKHALGNCWPIILSHLPGIMTYILSNLLLVEYLTNYKGAALRLYEAMGYHNYARHNIFSPGYIPPLFEANVIIPIFLTFMFLILIAKIISIIARYYFVPDWRGEK